MARYAESNRKVAGRRKNTHAASRAPGYKKKRPQRGASSVCSALPIGWANLLFGSADVENGGAYSDGLVGLINFHNAESGVTAGGSDFKAVCGQLSPVACADGSAMSNGGEAACVSCSHVVALCALKDTGLYDDGALAYVSGSSGDVQNFQNGLAAVVVDGVGLFVENEAVVDETTFDEPTGDTGGVLLCYFANSLRWQRSVCSFFHFHGSTDHIIHHAFRFRWFPLRGACP